MSSIIASIASCAVKEYPKGGALRSGDAVSDLEVHPLQRRRFLKWGSAAIGWALCGGGRAAEERPGLPQRAEFSFLHSYESTGRYWWGITQAGLLRPSCGVRLVNSPFGENDADRFNAVAAIGGPLHRILSDRRACFVIDRVCGGAPYRAYAFDQNLIRHYADLLGEKFLGGQVHEVLSNTGNDWKRLRTAMGEHGDDVIQAEKLREHLNWSGSKHWLEYGTLEDYVGRRGPRDDAEFWMEVERNLKRQAGRFGEHFSYAEGTNRGELVWSAFYGFGATSCFIEVGPWASSQTQFSIASARGSARAAGRPWGIFFAPWGPNGCTSWLSPEQSSWHAPDSSMENSQWSVGPAYGPSSAFQRRSFFHAYLSGAHSLHEEWGAECNLIDVERGTLSSYGRVTRDLLDFQDAHPDIGVPFTPIALVGVAGFPPNVAVWKEIKQALFTDSEFDRVQKTRTGQQRTEATCYPRMSLPEVFDVVPADASARLLEGYDEVIPAESPGSGDRLREAVARLCPFQHDTTLSMQINHRVSDDAWIIGLYNPWGAIRGEVETTGSILDPECLQHDRISSPMGVRDLRVLHAWPDTTKARLDGSAVSCEVGPGGTLILELHLNRH